MSNSSLRAKRRANKESGVAPAPKKAAPAPKKAAPAPKKAAPAPKKAAPKQSLADRLTRKKVNKK